MSKGLKWIHHVDIIINVDPNNLASGPQKLNCFSGYFFLKN